jgi:hypothetical protein
MMTTITSLVWAITARLCTDSEIGFLGPIYILCMEAELKLCLREMHLVGSSTWENG